MRPAFREITPGLDYAHVVVSNAPLSIHVARLARARKELGIATTMGGGHTQGVATLGEMIAAFPAARGEPLAAVNGDYFVKAPMPFAGDPSGLLIVDGELVSAPSCHTFWADADGGLAMGHVYSQFEVTWPDGKTTPLALNEFPKPDAATLLTSAAGSSVPTSNGVVLRLERAEGRAWPPLKANSRFPARLRDITRPGTIQPDDDALALALTDEATNRAAALHPGDTLQISTAMTSDLGRAQTAISGIPTLLKNRRVVDFPSEGLNGLLHPRNPRTAAGFNKKYFYLVAVDGRQETSRGLTLPELAEFMRAELGCTDALNLDGGGSTTFWLGGKILNSPSDGAPRPLGDAIFILRKAASPSK